MAETHVPEDSTLLQVRPFMNPHRAVPSRGPGEEGGRQAICRSIGSL